MYDYIQFCSGGGGGGEGILRGYFVSEGREGWGCRVQYNLITTW